MVKVNFPHPEKQPGVPDAYASGFSSQEAIDAVVRSANRSLLLVSGGERAGDEAMLDKARRSMEAGATGLIFGRNVWQREHDESLHFAARLKEILAKYPLRVTREAQPKTSSQACPVMVDRSAALVRRGSRPTLSQTARAGPGTESLIPLSARDYHRWSWMPGEVRPCRV